MHGSVTPAEAASPDPLRLVRVGYDHPDVATLVEEVQAFYVERYGAPDETPLDPLMFQPPAGSFFLGYLPDREADLGPAPVCSGAWRRTDKGVVPGAPEGTATAEVKRMWVAPRARRLGLGRRVLAHLEVDAAAHGFGALVLETGTRQPEAIAMYEAAGYVPVVGYGHYKDDPESVYLGRLI